MPKKVQKVVRTSLSVEGVKIPVHISYEQRRDVRYSIARSAAYLRIPYLLSSTKQQQYWEQFQQWVRSELLRQPELQQRFQQRHYADGMNLQVGRYTYTLRFHETQKRSHYARLDGQSIHIELSTQGNQNSQKAISHLISRCVARHQLPYIEKRVRELNNRYFQKTINKVRLKLNQSNWGSCSARGNINLSTRLLFAPEVVIDYVIIHELAHLIELNHSPAFWQLVADVMPDYREHERWLKENSSKCQF